MSELVLNNRIIVFFCLLSAILCSVQVSASLNIISQGGDVFIGEEGLDVTSAVGAFNQVAWFASGTNPSTDTPNAVIAVGNQASFYVAPADFVGKTGNWYRWDGGATRNQVAFRAVDPNIAIKVWDQNANRDVTGKSVSVGNYENFRVESNLFSVTSRAGYFDEGFVNIRVINPEGTGYTGLWQSTTEYLPLTDQVVDSSLWYWVPPGDPTQGWNTGVININGQEVYNFGVYIVYAEINLNNLINNYRAPDGSAYTGKTRTTTNTLTIASPTPTPTTYPTPTPSLLQELELYPGWNFISIPKTAMADYDTAGYIFKDVNTDGRAIFYYDSCQKRWKSILSSDIIEPLKGYWIYSTEHLSITLKLTHTPIPTNHLCEGWNAIGFSDIYPATAKDTLSCLEDRWSILIDYDEIKQQYGLSIFNGGSDVHSDTRMMAPKKGYWLFMNSDGDLVAISSSS